MQGTTTPRQETHDPNEATPSGSLAASSQASGSYLAQLTPRHQRWSMRTTIDAKEGRRPIPYERDDCIHVAGETCGPSGEGREEELEAVDYRVACRCDVTEERGGDGYATELAQIPAGLKIADITPETDFLVDSLSSGPAGCCSRTFFAEGPVMSRIVGTE
ncbi:hypothetical protein Landi51_01773 [Colletotrichum acutatum]